MNWKQKVSNKFSNSKSADYWDNLYKGETTTLNQHIFITRKNYSINIVEKNCTKDALILDLGCGAGPVHSQLRDNGYTCFGVDYSQDMLQLAKKNGATSKTMCSSLAQADCENLPFENASFNQVVCLGVISHAQNPQKALQEIDRVMKEDGAALMSFRNSYNQLFWDLARMPMFLITRLFSRNRYGTNKANKMGHPLNPFHIKQMLSHSSKTHLYCKCIGYGPLRFRGKVLLSDKNQILFSRGFQKLFDILGSEKLRFLFADVIIFVYRK